MNIFKKFLAMFLTICILIGAVSVTAYGAEDGGTDSGIPEQSEAVESSEPDSSSENSPEALASAGAPEKPAEGSTVNAPFPANTAGSYSFRIPALVTLSSGRMVAVADARWNTTFDGGGLDTIVSYSDDNGAKWNYTFANYLGDNGDSYNGNSTCFIDPSLAVTADDTIYMLADLYPSGVALNGNKETVPDYAVGFDSNGKLLLTDDGYNAVSRTYDFYLDGEKIYPIGSDIPVTGYKVDSHFNIYTVAEDGTETYLSNLFFDDSPYCVARTGYLYLTKSVDKGETWSAPTLLNLKTAAEQVCLVGPGRGLVTDDGVIIFPVYSYKNVNNVEYKYTALIYSTDGGSTWKRSTGVTDPGTTSEAAMVELDNGKIRTFFRNDLSQLCYADFDLTAGTWGGCKKTGVPCNSDTELSAIVYSKKVEQGSVLKDVVLVSCPAGPNGAGTNDNNGAYRSSGKIFAGLIDPATYEMTWLSSSVAVTPVATSAFSGSTYTAEQGFFGYSCLTEQKGNGSVSILYEDSQQGWGTGTGYGYTMAFKTYTESQLEAAFGVTFADSDEDSGSSEDDNTSNTVNVTLKVGQTYTASVTGVCLTGDQSGTAANITLTGTDAELSFLPVTNQDGITSGNPYVIENTKTQAFLTDNGDKKAPGKWGEKPCLETLSTAEDPAVKNRELWTMTKSGDRYTVTQDGRYLAIAGFEAYAQDTEAKLVLTYTDKGWTIYDDTTWESKKHDKANYYLSDSVGDNYYGYAQGTSSTGNEYIYWNLYEAVTDVPARTDITVVGTAVGTATVTVGDTTYNITVEPNGATKTLNVSVKVGNSITCTDSSGNYVNHANNFDPYGKIATMAVTGKDGNAEPTVATQKATQLENGATYIIRVFNTSYALSTDTGSYAWQTSTRAFQWNALTINEKHMWTLEAVDGGYKLKSANGYLNLGTGNNSAYLNTTGEVFTLTYTATGWIIGNQNGRYINALGGLTNYYSAGGWTGDGTRFDLYQVITETPGSTEVTFTGISTGTTTAVVGNTQYNITVYNHEEVTVNYQLDGNTVVTGVITVPLEAVSATLPRVVSHNGNYYQVVSTALELTNGYGVAYNVPVTQINCEEVRVQERGSLSEVLEHTLAEGQYAIWTSEDTASVSAAVNYSAAGAVTNGGTIIGLKKTSEPVHVTATVYNSDGTAAYTKTYLVTVTEGTASTNTTSKAIQIAISKIQNCTVYYAINGGELIEITDDMLEAHTDENGNVYYSLNVESDYLIDTMYTGGFHIAFFADPDDGHALTYMASTNSHGQYYCLSNGNPDGVGSNAWPYNQSGGYDESNGLRWGLIEGNFTKEQMKVMYTNAIAKGCDGVLVFTKNKQGNGALGGEGNSENDLFTDLTFIADPMPKVEKVVDGVLPTGGKFENYQRYVNNMVAAVDEIVFFKITVTLDRPITWKETTDAEGNSVILTDEYGQVGTITYSAASLVDDALEDPTTAKTDAYFYTKELDTLDNGAWDGIVDEELRENSKDLTELLNRGWADDEMTRKLEFYLAYQIAEKDIPRFRITNTASFDFNYQSVYSIGALDSHANADANITVVGKAMKNLVIDFGQPVVYTGLTNEYLKGVFVDGVNDDGITTKCKTEAAYGTASVTRKQMVDENGSPLFDGNNYPLYEYTVTYTPTSILQEPDIVLLYGIGENNQEKVINGFMVYPATTVYYEEGFAFTDTAKITGTWNLKNSKTATEGISQTAEFLGVPGKNEAGADIIVTAKIHNYGFDPIYNSDDAPSRSYAATTDIKATTTFEFTGNGIQVFANCTEDSGYVAVEVRNKATGKLVRLSMVDTVVDEGTTGATDSQTGNLDGLPVVSLLNIQKMPHGTYTVKISKIMDSKPVYIDGIRIFNTVPDSSSFAIDKEDSPEFYELRDAVLHALGVSSSNNPSQNYKKLTQQLYDASRGACALILDETVDYGSSSTVQDLLDNGPKNELYIYPGQSLVFNVNTSRALQVGLKAPQGETTASIRVNGQETVKGGAAIRSSVDMFYSLVSAPSGDHTSTYSVTVKNTGENILSVTLLKFCNDPGTTLTELTLADIQSALNSIHSAGEDGAANAYVGVIQDEDGNCYYIASDNTVVRDCNITIEEGMTNGLIKAGNYTIGSDGKIVIDASDVTTAAKNGLSVDADGEIRFYVNGVPTYAGVVKDDAGNLYYINASKVAVRDCSFHITPGKANGLIEPGVYRIDATGKLVVSDDDTASAAKNGLTFDPDGEIRFYVDGVAVYAGLVQDVDGSYYYINSLLKAAKSCAYAISESKANGLMPGGVYIFGADGRMIPPGS